MLRRLSYLTPGDGFRRSYPLNILADVKDATGQILTGATGPLIAVLEPNFIGIQVAASTTFAGRFDWVVPADYDQSADELRIRVAATMNGNTNSGIKLTPTIYRKRPVPNIIPDDLTALPAGLALSADLGAPASSAIPLLGSNLLASWVEINADYWTDFTRQTANRSLAAMADASIKPGDLLSIVLTAAAHTTDAINIYGATLWYRSNLAFSDIASR
jgi:hypothetical protein